MRPLATTAAPVVEAAVDAGGPALGIEPEIALAAARDRMRAERDWAIRGAHRHGVPVPAIARMTNLSTWQIAQIVAH